MSVCCLPWCSFFSFLFYFNLQLDLLTVCGCIQGKPDALLMLLLKLSRRAGRATCFLFRLHLVLFNTSVPSRASLQGRRSPPCCRSYSFSRTATFPPRRDNAEQCAFCFWAMKQNHLGSHQTLTAWWFDLRFCLRLHSPAVTHPEAIFDQESEKYNLSRNLESCVNAQNRHRLTLWHW